MYKPLIISGPTLEPVMLQELKDHVRVVGTSEDFYIEALGKAAREYVEWRTGRTFFETTYEVVFDTFPESSSCPLVLPMAAPLLSVAWIKYTDSTGAVTTMAESDYIVNTSCLPGCVIPAHGAGWPSFVPYPMAAVKVRYAAGLSSSASPMVYPPESIGHLIKLLVGALYENREGEIIPDSRSNVAVLSLRYGIEALIAQHQVRYPF